MDLDGVSSLTSRVWMLAHIHGSLSDKLRHIRDRITNKDADMYHANYTRTSLHDAAQEGDLPRIEALIEEGQNIEAMTMEFKTPLRIAIDNDQAEAAIALLDRGASMERKRDCGERCLRKAVKMGNEKIVEQLLMRGAKPHFTYPAEVAVDGGKRACIYQLLDAYQSLPHALKSQSRYVVLGVLRQPFISKKTTELKSNHEMLRQALEDTTDARWKKILKDVLSDFELEMLEWAIRTGSDDVQNVKELVNKDEWPGVTRFSDGTTLLHRAASAQDFVLVEKLLEAGVDPYIRDMYDKRAFEVLPEYELVEPLRVAIFQYTKNTFDSIAHDLLSEPDTTKKPQDLLKYMSSMEDLRIAFNIAVGIVSSDELHTFVHEALGRAIDHRLMFDDKGMELFIVALRECKKRKLISKVQKDNWLVRGTRVNCENAAWVWGMKRSLDQIDHRLKWTEFGVHTLEVNFRALQRTLQAQEESEEKSRKVRLMISVTCASLVLIGGPLLQNWLETMFDLSAPGPVLAALTEPIMAAPHQAANFASQAVGDLVVKEGLREMLEDASISSSDFIVAFQLAIAYEEKRRFKKRLGDATHSSTETYAVEDGWAVPDDSKAEGWTRSRFDNNSTLFEQVAHQVRATKLEEKESVSFGGTTQYLLVDFSTLDMEDLIAHPYHYAVFDSRGDKSKFMEWMQLVEGEDVNATMAFRIRKSKQAEEWQVKECTAMTLASYLGYEALVEWFLTQEDVENAEKSFSTRARAQFVANERRSSNS